jgi:hypothetical protein
MKTKTTSVILIYRRMLRAYKRKRGIRLSGEELDAIMLSDELGGIIRLTVEVNAEYKP